jgi:hypothetical protein
MKVYLHTETHEIKSLVDFENNIYAEEDEWEDDLKEIEEDHDHFLLFEKMSSGESYRVMEEFVETVKDKELKKKLELGLSLSNPFQNFRDIIDGYQDYKEKWFEFKNEKYVDYINAKLEYYKHELK